MMWELFPLLIQHYCVLFHFQVIRFYFLWLSQDGPASQLASQLLSSCSPLSTYNNQEWVSNAALWPSLASKLTSYSWWTFCGNKTAQLLNSRELMRICLCTASATATSTVVVMATATATAIATAAAALCNLVELPSETMASVNWFPLSSGRYRILSWWCYRYCYYCSYRNSWQLLVRGLEL